MERVFLRSLAKDPRDHVTRGVYADWLEEHRPPQAEPKAEFLRTTVVAAQLAADDKDRAALNQRLHALAATLPAKWLSVVSCLPVENCHVCEKTSADISRESPFHFLCDRRWEDLHPTDSKAVRFCDSCREQVHFCPTLDEARLHSESGHCVALSPHLARRPGDIAPPLPLEFARGMFFSAPTAEPGDEADAPATPPRRSRQRRRGRSRGA